MGESSNQNTDFSLRGLLCSSAVSVAFIAMLYGFLEPRWETNDDVAMSMIAHGYGIAAYSSPNLIFSNVLWGHLVRWIPEINGVLGYSLATIALLFAVGTVLTLFLAFIGIGYVATLAILALILVRPVLFPQFTVNSGMLTMSAIICWNLYERQNNKWTLLIGCSLAFLGYLVRSQEFFLVLGVGLPLLPWVTLGSQRAFKIAVAGLAAVVAFSAAIDHLAYQSPEWKAFNELNPARLPFTDFGAGSHLKQRCDILEHYGYTGNDIDLISGWFFVDPTIANPIKLKGMLDAMGPLINQSNSLDNALLGIKTLWHPKLFPIVLAALSLALLRPSWKVIGAWMLFIAGVFVLGLLGRPGIIRIYVALICLLLVAPLLIPPTWRKAQGMWYRFFLITMISMAALVNTAAVFSECRTAQATSEQIRDELKEFPNSPIIIWGGAFPFEDVYPVLGASRSFMEYRLYSLGVMTLAPFSVASDEEKAGQGIIDCLLGESGLSVIAKETRVESLEKYCKEHLSGELKEVSVEQYGRVKISRYRCELEP